MTDEKNKPDTPDSFLEEKFDSMLEEIRSLRNSKLIRMHESFIKIFMVQFLKGAAFGLGSLLGAGLILIVVTFLLRQIEFLPIIGDFINQLLGHINQNTP